MSPNLRQIVNGALLGQYNGKNVSLIGCVLKLESNGSAIEIRTTDDHIIKVMLQRPMNDILNMGTYVEIHGIVQGKSIVARDLICFENTEIDTEAHNKVVYYLHNMDDICKVYKKMLLDSMNKLSGNSMLN